MQIFIQSPLVRCSPLPSSNTTRRTLLLIRIMEHKEKLSIASGPSLLSGLLNYCTAFRPPQTGETVSLGKKGSDFREPPRSGCPIREFYTRKGRLVLEQQAMSSLAASRHSHIPPPPPPHTRALHAVKGTS